MDLGSAVQVLLHGMCVPIRGSMLEMWLSQPKQQSYQKEHDRTATKLYYKSSEPCNDTAH